MPRSARDPRETGNTQSNRLYFRLELKSAVKGEIVTNTGLQKLAFFMLLALILYVTITGGS